MIDLKLNNDITIEQKKSRGYSIKINDARLCNVQPKENIYQVVCRSKVYADAFPVSYKISKGYMDSRNYRFYTAQLSKKQLETWLDDVIEIGINKRLDNR